MKTNDIKFWIGKHIYTACFKAIDGEAYGEVANTPQNEAVKTEELDIDCWGIYFASKDNPEHTIEVNMGYDDDGNRGDEAFYAMIYDGDGNEVDEGVSVTVISK